MIRETMIRRPLLRGAGQTLPGPLVIDLLPGAHVECFNRSTCPVPLQTGHVMNRSSPWL
jgi:hypothetical protein